MNAPHRVCVRCRARTGAHDRWRSSAGDKASILGHILAFHHLYRGKVRGDDVAQITREWVPEATPNNPDAALRQIAKCLRVMRDEGGIDGVGLKALTERLACFAQAQAGNERLLTTPLPFVYSLLVRRTIWLYCLLIPFGLFETAGWFEPLMAATVAYVFFGLSEVTHELETPFADTPNNGPLSALCRTMEITVCHALGRPAPAPLTPVNHVLS